MNLIDYYITPEEYETAERNGISRVLLDKRVRDLLWDKETAINKPPRKQDYSLSKYADVAEQNGIHRNTFFTRVKSGMPPEKAMMKPLQDKKKWSEQMKQRRKKRYPAFVYEKIKEIGLTASNFHQRMLTGRYTLYEACTIPKRTREQCARMSHESRRRSIS